MGVPGHRRRAQQGPSMPFTIRCAACRALLSLPDEVVGRLVCCSQCRKTFTARRPSAGPDRGTEERRAPARPAPAGPGPRGRPRVAPLVVGGLLACVLGGVGAFWLFVPPTKPGDVGRFVEPLDRPVVPPPEERPPD